MPNLDLAEVRGPESHLRGQEGGNPLNKRELVKTMTGRLGDKRTANEAVNAVVEAIEEAVARGERVTISGFGVFERVDRPARYARNPSTGERIRVEKTTVPRFRPGSDFKDLVREERS